MGRARCYSERYPVRHSNTVSAVLEYVRVEFCISEFEYLQVHKDPSFAAGRICSFSPLCVLSLALNVFFWRIQRARFSSSQPTYFHALFVFRLNISYSSCHHIIPHSHPMSACHFFILFSAAGVEGARFRC